MVLGKDLTSEGKQSLMHGSTKFDNWNKVEEPNFPHILE